MATTTLLHDMIHKEVKVYIDDMIVKAKEIEDYVGILRKFFERFREYKMRLNLKKCVFGVTVGKLLGFLIPKRGIEVDLAKIKAILWMKLCKTKE